MEVAQQTGVPNGWEVVSASPSAPKPSGGYWEDTPAGKMWHSTARPAGERADQNIVGIDRQKIQQSIANWASTLSPALRKPAAILATFPADVIASLVETLSAPEVVAGAPGIQKAAGAAMDATVNAGARLVPSQQTVGQGLQVVGKVLQHPLRSPGRLVEQIGKRLQANATAADTVATPATAPAGARPPASAPGAAAPAAAVTPQSAPVPRGLTKAQLTPDELTAFEQFAQQGHPEADVLQAIADHRATTPAAPTPPTPAKKMTVQGLRGSEAAEYKRFRLKMGHNEAMDLIRQQRAYQEAHGLKTTEEIHNRVANRNADPNGRWPDDEP